MPRFFIGDHSISGEKMIIRNPESRHIFNVLRLRVGDVINTFDGKGSEYVALIEKASALAIEARIIEEKKIDTEPSCGIVLFQGFLKSQKMDFVVEKCTEIGICKIIPLITERTIVEIKETYADKQMHNRLFRWGRIAQSASKQSGRLKVPEIMMPMTFNEALKEKTDLSFIAWELEKKKGIKQILANKDILKIKEIGIFIGPEGGFTKEEVGKAVHEGVMSVTLGQRILRSETSGMVMSAIILHEIESLKI